MVHVCGGCRVENACSLVLRREMGIYFSAQESSEVRSCQTLNSSQFCNQGGE